MAFLLYSVHASCVDASIDDLFILGIAGSLFAELDAWSDLSYHLALASSCVFGTD